MTCAKAIPFDAGQTFGRPRPGAAPIVGRLEMMWEATRDTVIKNFPKAPGLPKDSGAYLRNVDEIYQSDAYHSLSIEGYSVTPGSHRKSAARKLEPGQR